MCELGLGRWRLCWRGVPEAQFHTPAAEIVFKCTSIFCFISSMDVLIVTLGAAIGKVALGLKLLARGLMYLMINR